MNNHGYSRKLVRANYEADTSQVGVFLGRQCMVKDIPVKKVAKDLGVTRQTVYLWFTGQVDPHPDMASKIRAYIAKINREQAD
jgi:plasmid maintenance system antidote protein VapI